MKRRTILMTAALLGSAGVCAATATSAPPELRSVLPSATLSGSMRFRYWGFPVYDASLWVQPGFTSQAFERHGFALQLRYLRDFTNAAITRRSIDEMTRLAGSPTAERRQLWQRWLQDAFPDVQEGDRISGINRPGDGVLFLTNGRQTGTVADAEFARLFFGIWLAAGTSEPAMRQTLLSHSGGS